MQIIRELYLQKANQKVLETLKSSQYNTQEQVWAAPYRPLTPRNESNGFS